MPLISLADWLVICVCVGEEERGRRQGRVKWFTPGKTVTQPHTYLVATLFTGATRCTGPGIHLGCNLAIYKRAVY